MEAVTASERHVTVRKATSHRTDRQTDILTKSHQTRTKLATAKVRMTMMMMMMGAFLSPDTRVGTPPAPV
jgi:hypothetical protein